MVAISLDGTASALHGQFVVALGNMQHQWHCMALPDLYENGVHGIHADEMATHIHVISSLASWHLAPSICMALHGLPCTVLHGHPHG